MVKTGEMAGKSGCLISMRLKRSPVPGQEFVEPVDRVLGDTGQDVGQPGLRIDVVHFGRDDDAVHGSSALSAAIGPRKQPGLAAEGNRRVILPISGKKLRFTTGGMHSTAVRCGAITVRSAPAL